MTKFQDGPAKGSTLMLKRTPIFLRVTEVLGVFDALNELDDVPRPEEKLYCYKFAVHRGNAHINAGRGRSGFYPMVDYAICDRQPTDAQMRDNKSWAAWCDSQPEAKAGERHNQLDHSA